MQIKWLGHASFEIKASDKVIYLDPYSGDYEDLADLILVSHAHYDHFNQEKIEGVRTDNTIIIGNKEVSSQTHAIIMVNGESRSFGNVKVECVPAYNVGKPFHPKGVNNGYIIEAEKKRVYFAGDSDLIAEMSKIKADVVLLPVGGTYTMNADEAAEAVLRIKPKLAIPMHFGSGVVGTIDDAELFKEKVEANSDIKVRILEEGDEIKV